MGPTHILLSRNWGAVLLTADQTTSPPANRWSKRLITEFLQREAANSRHKPAPTHFTLPKSLPHRQGCSRSLLRTSEVHARNRRRAAAWRRSPLYHPGTPSHHHTLMGKNHANQTQHSDPNGMPVSISSRGPSRTPGHRSPQRYTAVPSRPLPPQHHRSRPAQGRAAPASLSLRGGRQATVPAAEHISGTALSGFAAALPFSLPIRRPHATPQASAGASPTAAEPGRDRTTPAGAALTPSRARLARHAADASGRPPRERHYNQSCHRTAASAGQYLARVQEQRPITTGGLSQLSSGGAGPR